MVKKRNDDVELYQNIGMLCPSRVERYYMEQVKVAITGASSFSGFNLANYFSTNNFAVYASFPGVKSEYKDLKQYRLQNILPQVHISERISSVDGSMLHWIKEIKPQIWVHHFHFMKNWRSVEYNLGEARQNTIDPLRSIFDLLKVSNCLGIIYSSSVAEKPLEVALAEGRNLKETGFSPYAISKLEAWLEIKKISQELGIPLIRLVIPNPIGPAENTDRLIPNLVKHSLSGESYTLNNPNFMTHNIPIEELMEAYLVSAKLLLQKGMGLHQEVEPKTWSLPVLNFCEIINAELFEKRLGWKPCKLNYDPQKINQEEYSLYKKKDVPQNILKHLDIYAQWIKQEHHLSFYS